MEWVEGALLCGGLLASAVIAVRCRGSRDLLFAALGFALMCAACVLQPPESTFSGLWIAGCSAWALRGVAGPGLAVAAGSCAALAAAGGAALGLSWWIGIPAALLVVPATMRSALTRPHFAPLQVLDEALCGLAVGGLVLAAARPIMAGWQTALALNREAAESGLPTPGWVGVVVLGACLAGMAGAVWKRR